MPTAAATLLEHDIREPFSLDAEVVFHLAAQADVQTSMKRPEYDAAVNVVGTVNVLQAAPGAQVVFASSGGAGYGECPEPATEEAPFLPLSPYGIAKKCGEEYLAGWNRIHGSSHVSLRFGNVFGERQDAGYRLPPLHRGQLHVGPLSAEIIDPFGLARRRVTTVAERAITVLPAIDPAPLPPLGGGRQEPLAGLSRRVAAASAPQR